MEITQIASIILFIYVIVINIITCAAFGIDKRKAINGKRRISENSLFILGGMGGALGGMTGMLLFRHKTKHTQFRVGLALILIFQIAVLIWGFIGKSYF